MPAIGERAPDFELPDENGNPVKLSDFRGRKVILFAYPQADTDGCTKQACGFRDSFPTVETNNAMVLGISPDPIEDLKKWKNKMGFQYPLLSDIDHAVMEAWGAWGEKTSYGRTTIGVIRSHWVIDEDGNIIDEQIKITPEDSVRKALEVVGG